MLNHANPVPLSLDIIQHAQVRSFRLGQQSLATDQRVTCIGTSAFTKI